MRSLEDVLALRDHELWRFWRRCRHGRVQYLVRLPRGDIRRSSGRQSALIDFWRARTHNGREKERTDKRRVLLGNLHTRARETHAAEQPSPSVSTSAPPPRWSALKAPSH